MLFWLFFEIIIFLCFANYKFGEIRKSRYLPIIGLLFIILISAIRFDIGWDYGSYYESVYPYLDLDSISKKEPISREIIKLSYTYGYPPLLFIVFSLLTYGIAGYAIFKYSANVYISMLVYLAFFYLQTLGIIRQGLAISIIIMAIPSLMKKKYVVYSILVLIAYFVHSSSIIAFVFIPLFIITNRKALVLIMGFAIFSFYSLKIIVESFFPGYMNYLLNASQFQGGSIMMYFMLVIVCIVTFYSYKKNNLTMIKLSCISLVGILFPFFLGGHIGGRIASYFYVPLIYSLPIMFGYNINRNFKRLSILTLYVVFIMNIYVDSRNPIKSSLSPYKTIFTENIYNPRFK